MKGTNRLTVMVALLCWAVPLAAQDVTGDLEGRGVAVDGAPLAQADLILEGTGLPLGRMARTDVEGRFRLDQVPVGRYQLRLRRIGYRPVSLSGVVIRLGQTTTVGPVSLEPMAVELPELDVTAERPIIDVTSAAGGGNLLTEQVALLPIERSYRALPALLPGVNPEVEGLNIEGATGLENSYFVDGANVTDMYRGLTSTNLPYNFVQEVQVRSGGYEAEYRGALGGVVNVVTRSGGRRFEGEVFGYLLNNRLADDPRQVAGGNPPGAFTRFDLGASLGGPIRRDRLWFFAAYDPSIERETVGLPGLGSYEDRLVRHAFAAKLTWQPDRRTTLVGSVLGDPTSRDAVGSTFASYGVPSGFTSQDPWLGRLSSGGVTVSLHGSRSLSDRMTLQGSVFRVRQVEQNRPDRVGPPLFIDSTQVWSGGYPDDVRLINRRLGAGASATLLAGRHTLKGGIEVTEQLLEQRQFSHLIQQASAADYFTAIFDFSGTVKNRVPSVYLQDGWAVTDRLRINVGLRWDGQYLFGSDGHLALTIKDQWQPRLGVVYQVDVEGRSRFFGSFGRFYQDLHSNLGSLYHAYGSFFAFTGYPQDPRVDTAGAIAFGGVRFFRTPDPDLKGQSFDEWSSVYERQLGARLKGRLRGVHRRLGWGIEDGELAATGELVLGNPGRGRLGHLPRMKRSYSAIEVSLQGQVSERLWVLGSYVLSRSSGNHTGLYNSDFGYPFPNANGAFDIPELLRKADGPLPNDRPHVLKLNGGYQFPFGLSVGTSFVAQSGTPINELGGIPGRSILYKQFLVPRGTAGRTPASWDLGFRLTYMANRPVVGVMPGVLLDVYHVGSPRRALAVDQFRFFTTDSLGNQSGPNPNYRRPTRYQPPMSARLGAVLRF